MALKCIAGCNRVWMFSTCVLEGVVIVGVQFEWLRVKDKVITAEFYEDYMFSDAIPFLGWDHVPSL